MSEARGTAAPASTPAGWVRAASALGFYPTVLPFALRTALAAFLALLVAYALGLEHPHWAAMSVWSSSQPTREHLLSRGAYRFAGSVVGVIYAVALVLVAQDSVWVLALGLALWGGLCAFFGNLQRGFLVYGCMLAGYSAALVVLLHHGSNVSIWPFAWDRLLTVITGVAVALAVAWCLAPRRQAAVLIGQSRQALASVLQAVGARLCVPAVSATSAEASGPTAPSHAELLRSLAAVEELLELYPEGSRTARRTAKAMHWQQHCAMEVVYQLSASAGDAAWPHAAQGLPTQRLVAALEQLTAALRAAPQAPGQVHALDGAAQQAIAACEAWVAQWPVDGLTQPQPVPACINALYVLLQALQQGVQAEAFDLRRNAALAYTMSAGRAAALPLHRDWVGAREAALRAGGTLLVFGVLWAWTGIQLMALAMLGLSTMLLVFSNFESPSRTMAFVLRGQIIGAALALLCLTVVWPWAHGPWQMLWMSLPFALAGGLLFAHRHTAAGAMDTNMVMFLLLAPLFPDRLSAGQHVVMALAVVSAPALAWLAFRWVYPTNAQHRMQTLARMMWAEVPALAQRAVEEAPATWHPSAVPVPVSSEPAWQARLHHRVLRLVRWADKTQWPQRDTLPAMAHALRSMQESVLLVQQWRQSTTLATSALRRADRCARLALLRTAAWGADSAATASADKLQAAWQALAAQPAVPHALAQQAQRVAQHDVPLLHGAECCASVSKKRAACAC